MLNKLIFKDAWEVRDQIDNAQRKKIAGLYKDWADELEAKAKKFDAKSTLSAPMSAMNARELKNLLIAQSNAISQEVDQLIRRDMYVVADAVVKNNVKWLKDLGFGGTHLEGAFANVPTTVVENLVSGKVYQGGWSLSQRIWGDNEDTLSKLYEIVGAGRAQNLSTYEITKQLEQYVRPGAKKQWNLKTKDGKRIYPKQVDYNAQRLARTLSQHAYQQSFVATIAKNPMIPKVIWWANGSRVCKICLSLHGQKFDKDKVPLDHPNGMCVLIPDVNDNIEQQIADWVNAPDGTFQDMDEFAKSFGYVPKIKMPDIKDVANRIINENVSSNIVLSNNEKEVIKRYTSGGYKSINQQADEFLLGTPKDKAFSKSGEMLYDAVNSSNEKFDVLYRIEANNGFKIIDGKIVETPFKKGDEIVWGLRSTSKDKKFIEKAASGKDKNLQFVGKDDINTKIIFRMQEETGLDVSKISQYKSQQEVIVSGRFEVVSTGKIDKIGNEDVIIVDIKRKIKLK